MRLTLNHRPRSIPRSQLRSGIRRQKTSVYLRPLLFFFVIIAGQLSPILTTVHAITIESHANKTTATLDDQIVFTVSLSSSETQQLPTPNLSSSFDGFNVVVGPNRSTSIQFINAQMTAQAQFTWVLVPARLGSLTIPAANVTFKGKAYSTQPITIDVKDRSTDTAGLTDDSSDKDRTGRETDRESNKTLSFFRLELNKKNVYVGEQVTLEYVLYTREHVVDVGLKSSPALTNFWVEEVDLGSIQQARTTIDGVEYNRAILKQQILFPTTAGTQTLEATTLAIQVAVQTRSRSLFDDFFNDPFFGTSRSQPKYLNSRPVTIEVEALPTRGRPAGFSGMVGDYSVSAHVNRTQVKKGDSVTLTVTISGTGNINAITEPIVPDLPSLKLFSPTVSKKMSSGGGRINGSKSFEYIVIPSQEGEVIIPTFAAPFFSPTKKSYQQGTTAPITLSVSPGEMADTALPLIVSAPLGLQKDVTMIGKDINFIRQNAGHFIPGKRALVGQPWFWLVQALPLILIFVVAMTSWYRQRLMNDVVGQKSRQAKGIARKLLKQARKAQDRGSLPDTALALGKAISSYLAGKLNLAEAGLTSEQVKSTLIERNVNQSIITDAIHIMDQCDFVRFSPASFTSADIEAMLEKAARVIDDLEHMKWRH